MTREWVAVFGKGGRAVPRILCVFGLLALNVAIGASSSTAQVRDDTCAKIVGSTVCWCDQGPIAECAFDSECKDLHEGCEQTPE